MSRKTIIGYNQNQTTQEPITLDTHGTFLVDPTTFTPLVLPARWGIKEIRIKNAGPMLTSVTGTTKLIVYQGEVGQPNIDLMEVSLANLNLGTNVSLVGTDASLIADVLHYQKDLMVRTDIGSLAEGSIVCVQFKICASQGATGGNPPPHILANLSAPDAQCLNLQNGQTHTIVGEELSGVTSLDWYSISDPVNTNYQVGGRVAYDPATFDVYELVKNNYGSNPLTIRHSNFQIYGVFNDPDKNGYLIKRNKDGMVQWVARLYDADSAPDYQWHRVVFDQLNNAIQIAGGYTSTLTLYNANGSSGAVLLPPTNYQGVFTARYNTNGFVMWAARMDTNSLVIPTPDNEPRGMDLRINNLTGEVIFGTNWKLVLGNTITIYDGFGGLAATFTETSLLYPSTPDIIVKYTSTGSVSWTIMNRTLGNNIGDCYGDAALHSASGSFYWHTKLVPTCDYAIYSSDGSLVTVIPGASNSNHLLIKYDNLGIYQWHTLAQYAPPIGNGDGRIECDQVNGLVYGLYYVPVSTLTTVTFQQSDTSLVKPIEINGLAKNIIVCWGYNGQLLWRAKYGMGYIGVPVGPFDTIPHSITLNPVTGDVYFTMTTTINTATGVTLEFNDLNDVPTLIKNPTGGITKYLVKYSMFGIPKWAMRTKGQYLGLNYDGTVDARCGSKIVYNVEYQTGSKTSNSADQMIVHSSVTTGSGQAILQVQDNEEYSVIVNNVLTVYPSIVYTTKVPAVLCFKDPNVPFTRATMEPNGYFELKWNGSSFDLQKDHWVTFN